MYESMCCPVCELQLDFKPWRGESASDEICPKCGIQFGYQDVGPKDRWEYYREWREYWLSGASRSFPQDKDAAPGTSSADG